MNSSSSILTFDAETASTSRAAQQQREKSTTTTTTNNLSRPTKRKAAIALSEENENETSKDNENEQKNSEVAENLLATATTEAIAPIGGGGSGSSGSGHQLVAGGEVKFEEQQQQAKMQNTALTAATATTSSSTSTPATTIVDAAATAAAANNTTTITANSSNSSSCNENLTENQITAAEAAASSTPTSTTSQTSSPTTSTSSATNGHEAKHNGFVAAAAATAANNTASNGEAAAIATATANNNTETDPSSNTQQPQNESEMRGVDGQNNHAEGNGTATTTNTTTNTTSSGSGNVSGNGSTAQVDGNVEGNGNSSSGNGNSSAGGNGNGAIAKSNIRLDPSNQEIIRLIGQYLQDIGLEQSVETLMAESGCYLEHPAATKFRLHVLSGEWSKADAELKELEPLIENGKPSTITEIKFLLLEQKYLEHLDDGCPLDALHVLRNELTPLQHNISRVHQLSSYMMCSNNRDLHARAKWKGKGILSRGLVMERLQTFLPPSVMMSPRRLRTLLQQAVELQTQHCPCHNIAWETNLQNVSLLTDHCCATDGFPMQTIQILSHHCDEVWFCKFSPDGLKLATGSKDATVIIWDVDPYKLTLKHRRTLDSQSQTIVAFISWSPDSKLILVGGPEDTPEVCIWNVDDGKLVVKMSQSMEDSLTCGTFNRDGTRFVCGGQKGHFYLCDLNGGLVDSWEGVRINSVAFRSDNKTILAADNHYRIRGYTFDNARTEFDILKEPRPIMTFSINAADRLALLNISNQGLHLWDLEDKCLVRRFQGIRQSNFAIHSCFGGVNESFVASGSEDKFVVIWHIKREEPLAKLAGHTKAVTCVSWNPVYPSLLASASDDATVRIWGPKTNQANVTTESDDCSSCSSSSSWNMTS